MQRIEVNGLVYEFDDELFLMTLLDENADRVYEGVASKPPNDPLTLEELREMDGEPVWITPGGFWALVIAQRGKRVRLINHEGEIVWADKEIELVGPVYRRRPED